MLHGHLFLLHTSLLQEEDCPFIKWTPFTSSAIEVLQTTLNEKDPFFLHAWDFSCFKTPQSSAVGITRLTGQSFTTGRYLQRSYE
jgi:hypothetical protein